MNIKFKLDNIIFLLWNEINFVYFYDGFVRLIFISFVLASKSS